MPIIGTCLGSKPVGYLGPMFPSLYTNLKINRPEPLSIVITWVIHFKTSLQAWLLKEKANLPCDGWSFLHPISQSFPIHIISVSLSLSLFAKFSHF